MNGSPTAEAEIRQPACIAIAPDPKLHAETHPSLVPVGEQDEATPPAMARELADGLPNARFVLLPGCAHVPQLQAPDAFLREVTAFLGTERRGAA